MAIRNEFVEREWLLRHLGHTIGTHNVDHIINFARDAWLSRRRWLRNCFG